VSAEDTLKSLFVGSHEVTLFRASAGEVLQIDQQPVWLVDDFEPLADGRENALKAFIRELFGICQLNERSSLVIDPRVLGTIAHSLHMSCMRTWSLRRTACLDFSFSRCVGSRPSTASSTRRGSPFCKSTGFGGF